jgi:hypothetical protein
MVVYLELNTERLGEIQNRTNNFKEYLLLLIYDIFGR